MGDADKIKVEAIIVKFFDVSVLCLSRIIWDCSCTFYEEEFSFLS